MQYICTEDKFDIFLNDFFMEFLSNGDVVLIQMMNKNERKPNLI